MGRRNLTATLTLLSAMVLAIPNSATAGEWFLDLYGGVASTGDSKIRASDFTRVPNVEIVVNTSFDSSTAIGIRNGLWIGQSGGLGFAWDLSTFRAEGESVDIAVVEASGLILYRWRLARDPARPAGRVQPYVGAGLSTVYVSVDVEPQGSNRVSDWDLEDGLDLLAGVHWRASPKNGVFFEYRYSHVEMDIDSRGFFFNNLIREIRGDVDTHRFLIGWSRRFGG